MWHIWLVSFFAPLLGWSVGLTTVLNCILKTHCMLLLRLAFLFGSVFGGPIKSFDYSDTHHPYLPPTLLTVFLWQHDLSTEKPSTEIVLTAVLALKNSRRHERDMNGWYYDGLLTFNTIAAQLGTFTINILTWSGWIDTCWHFNLMTVLTGSTEFGGALPHCKSSLFENSN